MHTAVTPAFHALLDVNAPVRTIGTGFIFTEGPIWHPTEHHLRFSDMPGDVRREWDGAQVREIARPSNKGNGMTYDAQLNLLVCEHATSSVARFAPDGTRTVLASHYQGKELNSPNDIVVKSDGSIWFTDPWYGRMPHYGVERPRQLGWQGVFRIPPGGGDPELMVDRHMFSQPNGLCFCPDESKLYVNDTEQANIRVFRVQGDRLDGGRLFASGIRDGRLPGVPDGMKCDEQGNIWLTAPGGLWVYAPSGELIGKVAIPEQAANLHWGGHDWRTLFVAAGTSVYALPTRIGPRREPFMAASARQAAPQGGEPLRLDPTRCALIIQDMQNDVVMDGGAFAASGSPGHCRQQQNIPKTAELAAQCRKLGIPVIFVLFKVPPGGLGLTLNAPLFEGVLDNNALVEGTWGSEPVPGLEPQPGDHIVTKNRMSAWEGTTLETILKAEGRDILIECGAWTNMSVEHTARTGADKGYVMVIPEDGCSTMNADWHRASIDYAMTNVALVTKVATVIEALGR